MKAITQPEFEQRIRKRFPEESFTVIQYHSIGKPAIFQCNTCGEKIEVSTANNFLAPTKAYGCKNCHGLWRQREQNLEKLKEKYDIIKTEVKDTHTYYTVKCKNCGHERTTTLPNFMRHLDCGCTTKVYRNRTAEEFISEVNKHSIDGDYELVSDYTGQIDKVLARHKACGFIWSVRAADIVHGRSRCPKCGRKESKGAKLITAYLRELGIEFDKEHQLENSRQKFDFYIEKDGNKIAIEYNGAQHYLENNFFKASLQEQQELDERKRAYCLQNNIELIEIPYTMRDEEIKTLLKNRLNDYLEREQG